MNAVALGLAVSVVGSYTLAAIWRAAAWNASPAEVLIHDEGLPLGSRAPELAAHYGEEDYHLTFAGRYTFIAFGVDGCDPCAGLVEAATAHPATKRMRRVYVGTSDDLPGRLSRIPDWEVYRFHDGASARRQWRAPVNPYFYVIDERGRIRAKGIANQPAHLDRLLAILPARAPHVELSLSGGRTT